MPSLPALKHAIPVLVGLALLLLLAAVALSLPVRVWRTGEIGLSPLPLVRGHPPTAPDAPVWIDTDPACGHARRSDPDDCLALLILARSGLKIAGLSSTFGNAPLAVTDPTLRELRDQIIGEGQTLPEITAGAASPEDQGANRAAEALRAELEVRPLVILALGPLTNIAAALRGRPDLQRRVVRLVAVMGRRPGHLFHPAEGHPGGMLFGHGPVFRDLNFEKDRAAAREVMSMDLPVTLVPYDAARRVMLKGADLDVMGESGGAGAWVAARSRGWLGFWKDEVGRPGFYPFDALAALHVLAPEAFGCARVRAEVRRDKGLRAFPFRPLALLVSEHTERSGPERLYCPAVEAGLHGRLMHALKGEPAAHPAR